MQRLALELRDRKTGRREVGTQSLHDGESVDGTLLPCVPGGAGPGQVPSGRPRPRVSIDSTFGPPIISPIE
jgi:hypothetical protein